jgi:hypothetical protein
MPIANRLPKPHPLEDWQHGAYSIVLLALKGVDTLASLLWATGRCSAWARRTLESRQSCELVLHGGDGLGERVGSAALPAKTRMATGRSSASVCMPYSICSFLLPVAGVPAGGQLAVTPSTLDDDRSNITMPPSGRWRAASPASMSSWRGRQPVHRQRARRSCPRP